MTDGRGSQALVELTAVWKRYWLGEQGRFWPPHLRSRNALWSLRDVSLRVERGESVGLIGANGAGKTTTLKLLAGITRATRGQVQTRGRVASLINLGAGFHRELTGRENVLLNGVILGLSRREVQRRFGEIVEFAELGEFIDTPVKNYSSGMYARLGFAVATHVDADVLLVDEVLSVGDLGFQDRSMRRMLSFRERGCGILFVSHNLSAVEMMCQRVVWLEKGCIRREGPTAQVIDEYLEEVDKGLLEHSDQLARVTTGGAEAGVSAAPRVGRVRVLDVDDQPCSEFAYGAPLKVEIECLGPLTGEWPRARVSVEGDFGPLFGATTPVHAAATSADTCLLTCAFNEVPLLPGLYRVQVQLEQAALQAETATVAFRVVTDLAEFGSRSIVGRTKSRGGFLAVPYRWRLTSVEGLQELAGLRRPD